MADAVTTQTLRDGPRNVVMKFTGVSDGTGESAVTKVDVSTLSGSPSEVRIMRVDYTTAGVGIDVLWGASNDTLAMILPQDMSDSLDYSDIGGLFNSAGSGKTGDIKFTTNSPLDGDRYTVVLHMKKKY